MSDSLVIEWGSNPEEAASLVEFFTRNLTVEYPSHTEIMEGRYLDENTPNPDLKQILLEEFQDAAEHFSSSAETRLVVARDGNTIVCLSLVSFYKARLRPYGVVEDFIVDAGRRKQGIGQRVVAWIEQAAKNEGLLWLFLESGQRNQIAHEFFKSCKFQKCSVTMSKKLGQQTI